MILAKQNRNFVDFPGKMINANDDICQKKSGAFGAAKMINANDDFALNFSKSSMVFLKKLLTPQCFGKTLFRNQKFLNLMKTTILHFDDRTSNEHVLLVPGELSVWNSGKTILRTGKCRSEKKLKLIFEINFFASCI